MNPETTVQLIVIILSLVCGYIYLLQAVLKRLVNKNAKIPVAVLLFVIYAIVSAVLVNMLNTFGSMDMTMLMLLVLLSAVVVLSAIWGMIRNFGELRKSYLALYLVYLLGLAYITIFNRAGETKTGIYMVPFASLTEARNTGSSDFVNHMLLNVALFIPLGMLLPPIYPKKLNNWLYVLAIGIMCTTLIETTQYMLKLGECDIDDMIANVLGAMIGFAGYRIYDHFFGYRYEDEEEEEEDEEAEQG